MTDSKKSLKRQKDVSYQLENRQFVVHRQFGTEKTLTDLMVSEISHGILQNKPLNDSTGYGIMDS